MPGVNSDIIEVNKVLAFKHARQRVWAPIDTLSFFFFFLYVCVCVLN